MGTATLAARLLLAVVFGIAAFTKLSAPSASRATFREFGVGEAMAFIGSLLLAPAEFVTAAALMLVPAARWGAVGASLLLLVFIVGILNALRHGRKPDCGCFGGFRPIPVGRSTLIRNGGLLVVAVFVVVVGPGPALDGWFAAQTAGGLAVTAVVIVGAGAALVRIALTSTGPSRLEHETLQPTTRLAIGYPAPSFSLKDVQGCDRTLTSLCESGRPIVLVFGNYGCGSCASLFPHLARWQTALAERLQIVVIGSGDADAIRLIRQEFGLTEVLTDGDGAIWRAYGIRPSPTALVVGPDARIASGPAIGGEAIEDLIRLTLHRDQPKFSAWNQRTHAA